MMHLTVLNAQGLPVQRLTKLATHYITSWCPLRMPLTGKILLFGLPVLIDTPEVTVLAVKRCVLHVANEHK